MTGHLEQRSLHIYSLQHLKYLMLP